ncbi:MAG: hypothetical protein LUG44_04750 [Clostridiales bacterium]|nr:hypothetical protein [Clostridiales bacterium]
MELTREKVLPLVMRAYSPCYDIAYADEQDAPLVATAAFHEHDTGYVLTKRATMWTADRHEYVYLFSMPHLTLELYQSCLAKARELGEPLVDPAPGHMSTNIVALFLCDTADEDAVKALRKCRIQKCFQFSLRGWMEVHTAMVELGKDSFKANFAGQNTAKFLKNVLHPKVRRKPFPYRKKVRSVEKP